MVSSKRADRAGRDRSSFEQLDFQRTELRPDRQTSSGAGPLPAPEFPRSASRCELVVASAGREIFGGGRRDPAGWLRFRARRNAFIRLIPHRARETRP